MKLIPMILGHQYDSHFEAHEHAAVLIDILVVLLRRFRPVLFHPSVVLKCGSPVLLRWNIQEQLLHLFRLALHAEQDGMASLRECVEHLLHEERIHL